MSSASMGLAVRQSGHRYRKEPLPVHSSFLDLKSGEMGITSESLLIYHMKTSTKYSVHIVQDRGLIPEIDLTEKDASDILK